MTAEEMQIVLNEMGRKAKRAATALAILPDEAKQLCLFKMAEAIENNAAALKAANETDLKLAAKNNLSPAMIDRLTLNDARIAGMADGMRTVAKQLDPVGKVLSKSSAPTVWKSPKFPFLSESSALFTKPAPMLPLMPPEFVSRLEMRSYSAAAKRRSTPTWRSPEF